MAMDGLHYCNHICISTQLLARFFHTLPSTHFSKISQKISWTHHQGPQYFVNKQTYLLEVRNTPLSHSLLSIISKHQEQNSAPTLVIIVNILVKERSTIAARLNRPYLSDLPGYWSFKPPPPTRPQASNNISPAHESRYKDLLPIMTHRSYRQETWQPTRKNSRPTSPRL